MQTWPSLGRLPQCHHPSVIGVVVRVATLAPATTSAPAHVPPPVEVGDLLALGHRPILLMRVVDLVETGLHAPLVALVMVASGADGRALAVVAGWLDLRPNHELEDVNGREGEALPLKRSA